MSGLFKALKNTRNKILIVAIVAFLIYANSLPNKLLWDDHLFLEQWPQIQSFQNLGEILKGSAPPAQGKIYRPLRGVFYMIDYHLWGANPLGYRVQAVIIHMLCTILVFLIVRELMQGLGVRVWGLELKNKAQKQATIPYTLYPTTKWQASLIPFITALLFAVHPIHTETIDYISTSMESFGTVFFFLSFWLYLRVRKGNWGDLGNLGYWGSIILAGLAFFTYELTLTLPLLLALYELTLGREIREIWGKYGKILPYLGLALAFLAIRFSVLGLVSRTDYLGYSFFLTMLTMVKVFVRYIGLLFWPLNQTAIHNLVGDFPSSMIPYDKLDPILGQSIFDPDVLLSIVTIVLLILAAIKYIKKYPILSFSILWFFIALLPVSYIIPHGGAMAEKYLYIPSFGFLFLFAWFFYKLYEAKKAWRDIMVIIFITVIVLYSALTIARNGVWHDDISLFSDVVQKSPENLIANYTLGIWYGNYNQLDLARSHYEKALDKAPEFWQARLNLGNIYLRAGQFDKASESYQNVLSVSPNFKPAVNTLKNLSLLKQASDSAQIVGGDVLAKYKGKDVEFFFPSYWSVEEVGSSVVVKDADEGFRVEMEVVSKAAKMSITDFISSASSSGTLINQGLAQIPNFKQTYVRVYDDKGISKLQFFLSNGGDEATKMVKILVFPANSPQMRLFDLILGSIKMSEAPVSQ